MSQKLSHFLSRNLNLSLNFNLKLSYVAFSHVSTLSHVLPCFPILIQSSLHLVIFRHPYLTHIRSNLEILSAMDSIPHFLYIYCLDFHLKKKILPKTLRRFYGVISASLIQSSQWRKPTRNPLTLHPQGPRCTNPTWATSM